MNYFEAPDDYTKDEGIKVFLAGGIGNCEDWQQDVVRLFKGSDLTLLNPRRKHFESPWTTAASREQITWEFKAMEAADIILFWFAAGPSVQPIALYELGVWAGKVNKPVIVGRDDDYPRIDDIEIQLELRNGRSYPIYTSLTGLCDAVEHAAHQIETRGSKGRWLR